MTRRSFFASLAALVGVKCVLKPQAFIGVDWGLGESVTVYRTYSLPPEFLTWTTEGFQSRPFDARFHQPRKLGFVADEP